MCVNHNHERSNLVWIRCPACGATETGPRDRIKASWACYATKDRISAGDLTYCSWACREELASIVSEARRRGWSSERIESFRGAVARTMYNRTRRVTPDLWRWVCMFDADPTLRFFDGGSPARVRDHRPECFCATCGQHRPLTSVADAAHLQAHQRDGEGHGHE